MSATLQFSVNMELHERFAFLPFVKLCLRTERPKPYPLHPSSLGEHLIKRRMEAGLYQREVAVRLGVTLHTVLNWEKGWTEPEARHWPKIIGFLGCDPQPESAALGGRLQARYRALGLSRKEAGRRLGIDENSLKAYEDGACEPGEHNRKKLDRFLGS